MTLGQLAGGAVVLAILLMVIATAVKDTGWQVALTSLAIGLVGATALLLFAYLLSGALG
jgi:hypothetical protein